MTRRARQRTQDPFAGRQVDDELRFHHECTVAELVAAGMSPGDAEAEARRRFGPQRPYRQRLVKLDEARAHAQHRRAMMHVIAAGIRAAVRGIRRSPGFALVVAAILTLGLGVNAITFGLVDRLVLGGPAGLTSPDDLRRVVVHRQSSNGAAVATTDLGYLDYRDLIDAGTLAGAAAESGTPLLFGSGESAERIRAVLVTAGYFPLLGVTPHAGRFFTDDESAAEGTRLAVLGHGFWQRRFGGDPGAIGRVEAIGSNRYTIAGVAPPGFTGSSVARADVFLPLEAAADEQVSGEWRTSRNFSWIGAVVRLAPDATVRAAEDETTSRHRQGLAGVAGADPDARIELAPLNALSGETASGELGVAGLVGAVALLVLVIAIANTANLFLARALRRRETIALQLALGGSRSRLVAEQAVEGASLALLGAVVALGIASVGGRAVQRLLFPDVAWLEAPVDAGLLLVVGVAAVAGGALAAALPMWQVGRADAGGWLQAGTQRASHVRTRTQSAMLVVQGALSVLLLVGAGLFVRSLVQAQDVNLGLETDRLLVVGLVEGQGGMPPDLVVRLRGSVDRMPGVERTTLVAGTLPFVSSSAVRLAVDGLPDRPRVDDGGPYIAAVEPEYFATTGTRIVEGRAFTADDRRGAPPVVVVNQSMARLYWPGEDALGKCLRIGGDDPPCSTVVGVATNTRRQELVEGDSLLYYVPRDQAEGALGEGGRLLIRTADAAPETIARVAEMVRRTAFAFDPGLRYVTARNLDDLVSPQLRAWRLGAGLFSAFGVLALVVATIGLYSVVAFNVEGRRREMGVRAALGATGASLLGLVVRDGLKASAAGLATGLALAWLLAPFVAGLLYGVPARDGRVFVVVAAVLAAAAMLASAIPGLRAGRVDPSVALRES